MTQYEAEGSLNRLRFKAQALEVFDEPPKVSRVEKDYTGTIEGVPAKIVVSPDKSTRIYAYNERDLKKVQKTVLNKLAKNSDTDLCSKL